MPTLGFLRVGEKYKMVLAQLTVGDIAIYDTGRGNMPQIFLVGATQSGTYSQYREIIRYIFNGEHVYYRAYLTG